MKICVAGAYGAFGTKHLEALDNIEEVTVTSIMGPNTEKLETLSKARGIEHYSTRFEDCIERGDVDAVILATPTQLHAEQAVASMRAGKPVFIEIPMAASLADSLEICRVQKETGVMAMVGQVRRFNPSHQWIKKKIDAGDLNIQQMDVQTYFFRRKNINAKGEPRSWTDHLLWHHACHTVDLFQYQTGEVVSDCYGLQGPLNPELYIAMDMSIGMKTPSGAICTLSLSFNNDGPLGTFFRYICDKGTYIARYDDLCDGHENKIDLSDISLSDNGIELIDREFISAIKDSREPNGSVHDTLNAMRTLDRIEKTLL